MITLIVVVAAVMLFTLNLVREEQTPRYRCGVCGTGNGEHGKSCPWKK